MGSASAGTGDDAADDSGGTTGEGPVDTELPPLPELVNVQLRVVGDAANITFDPRDGAVDYRVYPLPADEDIDVHDDGSVVVTDAIYRCAGHREGLYYVREILGPEDGWNDNAAGGATVVDREVEGFARTEADAELGHVWPAGGEGRIPVYVLGDPSADSEGSWSAGGRATFSSTRPKRYVTDEDERDQLLAQGWRDDGIGFWIPATPGADTKPVYEASLGSDTLRWVDGAEAEARGAGTTLFEILAEPADDTVPLMRVHIVPYYTPEHDELAAGMARYVKARDEGDQPLTEVRWSGLTEKTVLVVEALDGGCPYLGNFSPVHQDPWQEAFGDQTLVYEGYSTVEDFAAVSPTGEVFINGQYDTDVAPKAIARSFVHVEPASPQMDFYATFPVSEGAGPTFSEPVEGGYAIEYFDSDLYHLSSYSNTAVHFGAALGEWWFAYNDLSADVGGMVRLTPHQKTEIDADSFLHVTTEVDILSTERRYPQIMISDVDAPIQDALAGGTTLIVQPKSFTPTHVQVQICDHRGWAVNDQCPLLPTLPEDRAPLGLLPGERVGTDNAVSFDLYLSSTRLYLFLDGQPYSCTDLPATSFDDGAVYAPPSGSVSVTWGDVLYHSSADFIGGGGEITGNSYLFHRTHMHLTTRRHFDNLGFSSGVSAPAWDEQLYPCVGGEG